MLDQKTQVNVIIIIIIIIIIMMIIMIIIMNFIKVSCLIAQT